VGQGAIIMNRPVDHKLPAAVMPILVPKWLHGASPEARETIAATIAAEFTRLMARDGVRAFEMPRSAAVAHETGHAIIETVLGSRVKSVAVHTCPQLARIGITAWGGIVQCHGDTGWRIEEDTPPRVIRERVYRIIAGFIAEMVLDPDNVRPGSSLDERVVGQILTLGVHEREGHTGHPSETWNGCCNWVAVTIRRNEEIARQLMAKLAVRNAIKGKPLDAVLRRVRP
jgi:hypothetical protein